MMSGGPKIDKPIGSAPRRLRGSALAAAVGELDSNDLGE